MKCTHHLDDGPLVCTAEEGHDYGCRFESATGSHLRSAHGQEMDDDD